MGKEWNIDRISVVFRHENQMFAVFKGFSEHFKCECTLVMLPKFSFTVERELR